MSATDPVINVDWLSGNCPVQAEGTIVLNGLRNERRYPFYFRARGDTWTVEIRWPDDKDCKQQLACLVQGFYGWWPDAGYMPEVVALRRIDEAAEFFAKAINAGYFATNETPLTRRRPLFGRLLRAPSYFKWNWKMMNLLPFSQRVFWSIKCTMGDLT